MEDFCCDKRVMGTIDNFVITMLSLMRFPQYDKVSGSDATNVKQS